MMNCLHRTKCTQLVHARRHPPPHKTTMSGRTPKWGTLLKAYFRKRIETRQINPNKTDKAYILSIRDKYYKDRPDKTFIKNYKASVAEWRIGHYVNSYNKRNACEFNCSGHFFNYTSGTHLLSQVKRKTTAPKRTKTLLDLATTKTKSHLDPTIPRSRKKKLTISKPVKKPCLLPARVLPRRRTTMPRRTLSRMSRPRRAR